MPQNGFVPQQQQQQQEDGDLPPILDDVQSDLEELEDDHIDMEVEEDLEAMEPKVGNVQAPRKDLESEPPSDPVKYPNTKTKEPKTPQDVEGENLVDVPSRKSRRIRRLTQKAEQIQRDAALAAEYLEPEPSTFKEAINDPVHGKAWKEAIKSELDSLAKNKTFVLRKRRREMRPITCKWVFKFKYDLTGRIIRHKARLVARGFSQRPGIDYDETFAPVAKFTTIRVLLALAAATDWEIHQMDIKTAFLYGDLDEQIFMELPEGIDADSNTICELRKSLYGLKQAPRVWYQKLDKFLTSKNLQLVRSDADHSLYVGKDLIIAVYVDDLKIMTSNMELMRQVKESLSKEFEMTDLGEMSHYLGMQIIRDRKNRTIHLNQAAYITKILKKFGMENCVAVSTPMDPKIKLETRKPEEASADKHRYQELIGSLIYAMIGTRPDIAFSVQKLSQFSSDPSVTHMQAAKRILRYLQGTKMLGITYGLGNSKLHGYADADYAGDINDAKSTGGYVFLMGGASICWSSKKQSTVATSTTHAEYIAGFEAAREAAWLQLLLDNLSISGISIPSEKPIVIYEDNSGCIALTKNPANHSRTKHIHVKYHYLRQQSEAGEIQLVQCKTNDMTADILTKALPRDKHERFSTLMGLDVWKS
jgi:hypothetical protein